MQSYLQLVNQCVHMMYVLHYNGKRLPPQQDFKLPTQFKGYCMKGFK